MIHVCTTNKLSLTGTMKGPRATTQVCRTDIQFNTGPLHRDPMTRVNEYKRKADTLDLPLFFSIFYGCTYQTACYKYYPSTCLE